MARIRRSTSHDFAYHLISRIIDRQWLIAGDDERNVYLTLLGNALAASDWRCFAFALMSNHVHLGVIAGKDPLASWIRDVHGPFAVWLNERLGRVGQVFMRGPIAHKYSFDGIQRLIGYIHRNPVRAGVVGIASESRWTSQRAYAGLSHCPEWLDVGLGTELSGCDRPGELARWIDGNDVDRPALHRSWVDKPRGRGRPIDLDFLWAEAETTIAPAWGLHEAEPSGFTRRAA